MLRYRLGSSLGNSLGHDPYVRVWFMVHVRVCLGYRLRYTLYSHGRERQPFSLKMLVVYV